MPGLFITIEGVEGAGKSTLAAALGKALRDQGYEVVVTEEPGGDDAARRIRQLVLDIETRVNERAELLLFEAARAQHVQSVIVPALERGAIVISDRFADSSTAYQGHARGIGTDTVEQLNRFATGGIEPDLTLLLDVAPQTGLAREQKLNRLSSESIAFHEKVREGYLALARRSGNRFAVIDASLGRQQVLQKALDAVKKLLPPPDHADQKTQSG